MLQKTTLRRGRIALTGLLLVALAGCASGRRYGDAGVDPDALPEGEAPVLKLQGDEVPKAVRAIETQIDKPGLLAAEEIVIHASRNYEWDVSLTGYDVSRQRPDGDDFVSVAKGGARAQFRNLHLRTWGNGRIVFRKSGLGVSPFIRITAKGHAVYATPKEGGGADKRQASAISIVNSEIHFHDGPDRPILEGERPVSVREGVTGR